MSHLICDQVSPADVSTKIQQKSGEQNCSSCFFFLFCCISKCFWPCVMVLCCCVGFALVQVVPTPAYVRNRLTHPTQTLTYAASWNPTPQCFPFFFKITGDFLLRSNQTHSKIELLSTGQIPTAFFVKLWDFFENYNCFVTGAHPQCYHPIGASQVFENGKVALKIWQDIRYHTLEIIV